MSVTSHKNQDYIAVVLSILILIFLVTIACTSSGVIGGADSYMHHLMAKWAYVHPHLLVDHWGKPVYTILSSPFAQFGLLGSVIFNALLTVLSAWISFKLAVRLKLVHPWLAVLFTVFVPVFFLVSFSSLTETLFATILILTLYLYHAQKYTWSIILVSFIPFVRTEGVIFFPLFIMALLALRKWKTVPYMATGLLFFSLVGAWYYHDFWWVFTQVPYGVSESIYGSGTLTHFILKSPMLFGWPILILFGVGCIGIIAQWKNGSTKENKVMTFLLLSISVGYFAAHSVVWAFGMGSSAGLTRVMAGIAPVVGMVAFIGFDFVVKHLKTTQFSQVVLPILVGLVVTIEGVSKHQLPIQKDREMAVVEKVNDYLIQYNLHSNFMAYTHPMAPYALGLDHFQTDMSTDYISNTSPEANLPVGALVIWDAHFGPDESGVAKATLETNPHFERLKTFEPDEPFSVVSGAPFEIVLYQKVRN
tara:strand:+ start:116763 stop:118190 length:1428 start_codon:yes stop_codon:yes gene_type:complete